MDIQGESVLFCIASIIIIITSIYIAPFQNRYKALTTITARSCKFGNKFNVNFTRLCYIKVAFASRRTRYKRKGEEETKRTVGEKPQHKGVYREKDTGECRPPNYP